MADSPAADARGVVAAVAVAARHGLRVTDPVVLRSASNLLVHLRPAPVVARVATTTALARPGVVAWLARDLAVAGYLTGRGLPVVPPTEELPPGPHQHDGLVLSFTTHLPHDRDRSPRPGEVAALLAELHAGLRGYPGALPERLPLDDIAAGLARLAGTGAVGEVELAALRAARDELVARWPFGAVASQPLQGDAHPGNLLFTPTGPVWNDFEDTWRGPVLWDLACLAATGRLAGRAEVAAYPHPPDAAELAPWLAVRRLHALVWGLLLAERVPAARADARARLAGFLAGA
ncbi:Phosphotransferase enzyme family protein [Goodfellowiella coeruleoviolacea]|uniref:Phosphotransferase enzyme family protein n=1 Tax=Goodfellowiella coeruleoviolacea TaxID=334858 RepID=A0AAE3GMR1_9PSEU|nr:Phosphotransferase enzyme family protein [Goodfellowiella coeruleoviolacea]